MSFSCRRATWISGSSTDPWRRHSLDYRISSLLVWRLTMVATDTSPWRRNTTCTLSRTLTCQHCLQCYQTEKCVMCQRQDGPRWMTSSRRRGESWTPELTTATHARTAVSTTAHRVTWLVTARRTAVLTTRRLDSVRTATRCTCRCPRTACTFARTVRVARVRTAASVSAGPGCCKAIFVPTPGRSRSSVRNVARPSPTSRICELMSRLILSRNRSCVAAAPRLSLSSHTYTSTKSRRACEVSGSMLNPREVTKIQMDNSDVRSETAPTDMQNRASHKKQAYVKSMHAYWQRAHETDEWQSDPGKMG